MTDLVWNKASLDTLGLNNYYESNKYLLDYNNMSAYGPIRANNLTT